MLSFIRKHNSSDSDDSSDSDENTSEADGYGSDHDEIIAMSLSDWEEEDENGWEEEEGNLDETDIHTTIEAERMRLSLPSNLKRVHIQADLYAILQKQEATMREGQINDALRKLRLTLGAKAWMLRNKVRNARGGKGRTRAWDSVKTKEQEVQRHVQIYLQARAALQRMGMGAEWRPITKQDLAMPGDLVEPNRFGQRSSSLPWFWRIEDGGVLDEIQESPEINESSILSVYRVNWLRLKARVARWTEEKKIVAHEMVWIVKSFKYFREQWADRVRKAGVEEPGLQAFAEKQIDLWDTFAKNAEEMFQWAKTTSKEERWRKKGPEVAMITVS
ncbi:hypothetical protein MSAN_01300600 [Mycena sanguinolenta]|uniref:Uncharacterized protein n=1 Tax=Mycena sanguinolenta TaxID=230812 RepID=A0A8H6YEY7_9AGAR|nr:hypothetical protein MSAN_01300600 [Mycena sanguinolenta]